MHEHTVFVDDDRKRGDPFEANVHPFLNGSVAIMVSHDEPFVPVQLCDKLAGNTPAGE